MNSFLEFGLVVTGQVTAISFAAVLLMLLSQRNAARRHSVGLLGLVIVLSSPLITWVLPQTAWWRMSSQQDSVPESERGLPDEMVARQWQPSFTPRVSRATEDVLVEPKPMPRMTETARTTGPLVSTVANASGNTKENALSSRNTGLRWLLNLFGAAWFAGAVISASIWAWQHWRLRWLTRSLSLGSELDPRAFENVAGEVCGALSLRGLPSIAVSEVVPMPLVLGIWRPVIVVPRELLQPEAVTRLRDVLIHECAHVARRDAWINAAQRLAAVLWWWHPGVLWLNRLITRSREEVCGNFARHIADRSGTVVNGPFRAVFRDAQRVVGQPDGDALAQGFESGVLDREASLFIDDLENGMQRLPGGILLRPAGQRLSRRVQKGDFAVVVGGDDRIANAGKRDTQPLLLLMQRFICLLPGVRHPGSQFMFIHGMTTYLLLSRLREKRRLTNRRMRVVLVSGHEELDLALTARVAFLVAARRIQRSRFTLRFAPRAGNDAGCQQED